MCINLTWVLSKLPIHTSFDTCMIPPMRVKGIVSYRFYYLRKFSLYLIQIQILIESLNRNNKVVYSIDNFHKSYFVAFNAQRCLYRPTIEVLISAMYRTTYEGCPIFKISRSIILKGGTLDQ